MLGLDEEIIGVKVFKSKKVGGDIQAADGYGLRVTGLGFRVARHANTQLETRNT